MVAGHFLVAGVLSVLVAAQGCAVVVSGSVIECDLSLRREFSLRKVQGVQSESQTEVDSSLPVGVVPSSGNLVPDPDLRP